MTRLGTSIAVVICLANWRPIPASAAEPIAAENKPSAVRLGLFKRIAEHVSISIVDNEKPMPVKMLAEPLYSQKSRATSDVKFWCCTNGGRPAAILTLACVLDYNPPMFFYSFDRLSAQSLTCAIDGIKESWTPHGPCIQMTAIPKAAPADDAPTRLKQVDEILSRLKCAELRSGNQAGKPQQIDLAWLPKPVHRYSDAEQGIVDGFLCFSFIDTRPVVVLVLEAQHHKNSAPAWYCGFNRFVTNEVKVLLDGKEIWKGPRLTGTSSEANYHKIAFQEPAKQTVAEPADDEVSALLRAKVQRSEDRKTRYAVPQGDVAALANYLETLAKFQPEDPADKVEHLLRFRPALQEAAQRIVKLEKDHESEAYQAARFIVLQNRVYWMAQVVPAERRQIVADVNEYLKEQLKQGNTGMATNLAGTTARALQRLGQWDEAIKLYESFAAQYADNRDGTIAAWGDSMRVRAERLQSENADAPKPAAAEIAPRGKMTPIDLSRAANGATSDWAGGSFHGNGFSELPKGELPLAGVTFAIGEKSLQLAGPSATHCPKQIDGIPVGRKLHRLYVLQAAQGSGAAGTDGALLATYKIHYADGSEESLPVELGKDVRDWYDHDDGRPVSRGSVVWTGTNTCSIRAGTTLRLYLGSWNNPHPEKSIATIAFTKANEPNYAPFCMAITAEE